MPNELVDVGVHTSQWMLCALLHIMYISEPTPLSPRQYAVLLASIIAQEPSIVCATNAQKPFRL